MTKYKYETKLEKEVTGPACGKSTLIVYRDGKEIGRLWKTYLPLAGIVGTYYITYCRKDYRLDVSSSLLDAFRCLHIASYDVDSVISTFPESYYRL